MEFASQEFGVKFTVPDRPTVRQQLAWFGAAAGRDPSDLFVRYWEGAKTLIQSWECAALPDYKVELDNISDPTQTNVIVWVAIQVRNHISAMEDLPKNS